jgi:CBS domain-containing protein
MKATTVRDLMTSDVVTLDEKDDFVSADQIMTLTHVRHLPVVRGKKSSSGSSRTATSSERRRSCSGRSRPRTKHGRSRSASRTS